MAKVKQEFYVTLQMETTSEKKITEEGAKRLLKEYMKGDTVEGVDVVRITDVIEDTPKKTKK